MQDKERSYEISDIKPLMKQISNLPLLTKAEEHELVWIYQNSEDEAERKQALSTLTKRNIRLIVKKAKAYMGKGLRLEDLVQEGYEGLQIAIDKFDLSKNLKLSTYANWWIMQRISRAVANKSRLVKIPISQLDKITKLHIEYIAFIEEHNRAPSSQELGDKLGISKEKAEEYGRMLYEHMSLDTTIGEDDNLSMVDYIVDESLPSEDSVESVADKEYVRFLLSFLTKEDSNFIKLKYGFLDQEERSDRQMATIMKIPIKQVKETEQRILLDLQERADMFKINTPVPCILKINHIPAREYTQVVEYLSKILNIDFTRARILIKDLPVNAISKIDQHLALSYKGDLEGLGATVEIIKYQ